jgi:hypothetical protein
VDSLSTMKKAKHLKVSRDVEPGEQNPDSLSLFVVERMLFGNYSYAATCGECEQRDDCSLKFGSVVGFQLAKALIVAMKAQPTQYMHIYRSKLHAGDNTESLIWDCFIFRLA